MAKFKHNKKRNSAFLYEVLIQELTKTVLSKNEKAQQKITALIKESFSRNTMMYRELKLYRAISHTKSVGILTAEKIINEVKVRHKELDKKQLMLEQDSLARKINKLLSDKAFSNFIPSYKDMASISQIFNQQTSIKSKILLENELVGKMSITREDTKMVPMDNIVYKSFVKRFNEEYKDTLLMEQKKLLNKFITSFHNNGIELKSYLNEEIGRLKKELKISLLQEEFIADEQMSKNARKVLKTLESYKEKKPDKKMVEEVIKIQGLIWEISANAN